MRKLTYIYINNYYNPVDLESIKTSCGCIKFNSMMDAYKFISKQGIFKYVNHDYVDIYPSYDSIQKKIQREGYFKAYAYVNNIFVHFLMK